MGYYSDVGIVVAFNKRDDMEKVLSVYKMNPDVQRLDTFAEWTIYESDDVHFLEYKNNYVKWYDDYDDVKAIRYLTELIETFSEEQDMLSYLLTSFSTVHYIGIYSKLVAEIGQPQVWIFKAHRWYKKMSSLTQKIGKKSLAVVGLPENYRGF